MRVVVSHLVVIAIAAGSAKAWAEQPAAPKKTLYERLRDGDGKVAGLAGFSIKRRVDKTRCGGIAIVTTHGKKVAKEDEALASVYKLAFPTGLSFDPDPKNAKKAAASQKKFEDFMTQVNKVGGNARRHYEDQLAGNGDMALKVAAAARIAQLTARVASILARAEIPIDVRTGESAVDEIQAYCERMQESAEMLQRSAELAMTVCAEKAKGVAPGWWNEVCVAP